MVSISAAERPSWTSIRVKPDSGSTSKTALSVMMRETQRTPVRGKTQDFKIFGRPFLSTRSMTIMTRVLSGLATRSIAPPIPLTLPGRPQFARSPYCETCIAPRIVMLTRPERIIPKDSSEPKKEAPGRTVTVSLPALMRSGSSVPSTG